MTHINTIDYAKFGSGPKTMVILPGIALHSTVRSADLVAEAFSFFIDYTIYLIDDRSAVDDNYTIATRAEDVAKLMTGLGLKDACVFGASLGGMVTMQLAITHPDLVKKIAIASTSAGPDSSAKAYIADWIRMANQDSLSQLIPMMLELIYSKEAYEQNKELLINSIGTVSDDELAKFAILANAAYHFDCADRLNQIACDALVIAAEGDRLFPHSKAKQIADALHGKFLLYGPEYGHAVYDEAPDFRHHIYDFFEA